MSAPVAVRDIDQTQTPVGGPFLDELHNLLSDVLTQVNIHTGIGEENAKLGIWIGIGDVSLEVCNTVTSALKEEL